MLETKSTIHCALCGIRFIPSAGSICPTCTIQTLEEEKMLSGEEVNFCRYCNRYERPPWINCERESQEMMAILLKKLKGTNKVDVQSAIFVWTEPHSKRLKLKVVYNREVTDTMKMEVTEIVEFVEKYVQCLDCRKKFTPHEWISLVQLRQPVLHKKTIFHLEQALLKEKLAEKIIKSETAENGVDFHFMSENDAKPLVDYLKNRFPTSIKVSEKQISYNERDDTHNTKTSYCISIPIINKDDLVKIPKKLSKELGSCCEVLLCTKVSSMLHFLDISNFKKVKISATQYFIYEVEIEIFTLKSYGKKFTVLDCEIKEQETSHKFSSYGLTFMKEDEFVERYTKCHFGDDVGNELMGFELSDIENFDGIKNLPDFLMIHKIKDKELKRKNRTIKRRKEAEIRRKESEALSRKQSELYDDSEEFSDEEEEQEINEEKEETKALEQMDEKNEIEKRDKEQAEK